MSSMLANTSDVITNLLAPMAAAQIFFTILVYFTIVRKRIAADYKLYACFLITFIIFLAGRAAGQFIERPGATFILYFRMALLFSVGIPSLLIAAARQSGIRPGRKLSCWLYAAGLLIAAGYVIFADASMARALFTANHLKSIPFAVRRQISLGIQVAGAAVLLVLPCGGLIVRELHSNRNGRLLAFLAGSFLFGILMVIGSIQARNIELYYLGSVFSALCWGWAVFQDVRDMKGKAALLKDELLFLVQSGDTRLAPETERLLGSLEELSQGDLDVYKLRIREVLNRFTDATIEAGGDSTLLIPRNTARAQAIEACSDPGVIREIIRTEAVELSEMIAEIPKQKESVLIKNAKAYLKAHYTDDLGIEMIAESLHVSREHLMRKFKIETGKTINQYLTGLRIERAKELLAEMPVTETAFEVGYNNSNYFNTVFKKQIGLTPGQFRKSIQNTRD